MKAFCFILVLAITGCRDMGQEPPAMPESEIDVINAQGVIQKISADLYVINVYPRSYIPLNLSADFRVDGLQVVVTGRTVIIPLNIGYPGIPLRISSIRINR